MSLIEMALAFVTTHPAVTARDHRAAHDGAAREPAAGARAEAERRRARPHRRDRAAGDEREPERHRLGPALARRPCGTPALASGDACTCASSRASSRPGASTWATTSARSPSTSPARSAARRSSASSTCTRSPSPTSPRELRERLYDTTAILLAAGLDPARCILFRQSDVRRAHRADLAALQRHRARAPAAHAPVPRQVDRPARARLGGAAAVSGAAGRRRARLPRRRGAGRARTSASTSS